MPDFAALRECMVERQIAARGIADPALLRAFRAVPRELFVSGDMQGRAYEDCALPIEAGQTISQPYIVAVMLDAAGLRPGDRVLEVGAGSGYAAALISLMAGRVIAIERIPELAALAKERLRLLRIQNVEIVEGDGSLGFPEGAPFDAILCAAAGPRVPEAWLEQLVPGGRIVMPVAGSFASQRLLWVTLTTEGQVREERLETVRFVPLIGAQGYAEGEGF